MKIGTREVGPGHPTFIIAECGSNHGGSLDAALALIDAAAEAGADAAKFQRFRVDSFLVPRPNPEALRRYELPDEWLPQLRARCGERGIEFLCTPFDVAAFRVLAPFVAAWKIGSYEAVHREFVDAAKYVVTEGLKYSRVILASDGLGDPVLRVWDIQMRCVSVYPAQTTGYLSRIPRSPWGVSDHTLDPLTVPAAAVALGACVVEKHMVLNYSDGGAQYQARIDAKDFPPDWPVSITPSDFASMVRAIRATESALGR